MASVIRSGSTPSASQANIGPVRPKPVMTSSTTNRMSSSRAASRIAFSQPAGGTITPPEPWIGSQKNAATLSAPSSATLARSAATDAAISACGVAALRVAVGVGRRDVVLRGQRQVEAAVEDRQRGQPGAGGRRAVVAALERDEVLLASAGRVRSSTAR